MLKEIIKELKEASFFYAYLLDGAEIKKGEYFRLSVVEKKIEITINDDFENLSYEHQKLYFVHELLHRQDSLNQEMWIG